MYRFRLDFKVFFATVVFFVGLCSASAYGSNILYFQDVNFESDAVISFTNNADTDDVLTIRAYDENGIPLDVSFRTLESGETDTVDVQDLPDGTTMVTVEFNGNVSFQQSIKSEDRSARGVRITNCINGTCITSYVAEGRGDIAPIWGGQSL